MSPSSAFRPWFFGVFAALAMATTARAEGEGDVVDLKAGGSLRGHIVELAPEDHVTITLADGRTARVAWSAIARVLRAGAALPAAGSPVPAPAVAGSVAAVKEPGAFVHVEADPAVRIQKRNVDHSWLHTCYAPCDQELDTTAEYRVVGDGIRTSAPFNLAAKPRDRVVVHVSTGSNGGLAGGIVLAGLGLPTALAGLLIVAIAKAGNALDSVSSGSSADVGYGGPSESTGWLVTGIGVGGMVGGVVLIVANAKTSVTQEDLRQDLRAREAAQRSLWALPPATGAPLLRLSF